MNKIYKNSNQKTFRSFNLRIGFVLMILTGFIFTSCEDKLEEIVHSNFTGDGFYKDPASAKLGLMGIYDILGSENLYARGYLLYFHTGTDLDRYWRQNRGLSDDLLCNYQIQENNPWLGSTWASFYKGVNRANLVIDRVTVLRDELVISDAQSKTITAYNLILAEAHFLRGFIYFQLVKNWGDVPLRLTSEIALDDLEIERSSKVEVYQQIGSDMLYAVNILPKASAVVSPERINKGAAQGILARVYLNWAGYPIQDVSKYEKAAEQAWAVVQSGEHAMNAVVENPPIGAPFDHPFPEVFMNLATNVYDLNESMWEIHFAHPSDSPADASTVGVWHGVTQHTSSSFLRGAPRRYALPTFFDSFEADDTFRRDWSISQFEIDKNDVFKSVKRSSLKWGVGKFRRYLMSVTSPNKNYDNMNWPIIRYADVLLMLSEGINETIANGGILPEGTSIDIAYEAINKVRRRARMLDPNATSTVDIIGSGGDDFRQQIRNERSWELCFENLRKPDLIRWGILEETVNQTRSAMTTAGYTKDYDYFPGINFESKHVLYPLPFAAEISQNPSILNSDPSNNGYR